MKATQSFKSEEIHSRILKMMFAAAYSEIYKKEEWRDYAYDEFNRLASAGDFLSRTFNCGGRLFLCFAFKWMVNHHMIKETERLGLLINRLFYRNDIIWDCSPDMLSLIDNNIDGEGIVMMTLLSDEDSLERYALQEKIIAHLNELKRILSDESKFVKSKDLLPLYLCSILHFVLECEKKRIFPYRTSFLLKKIKDLCGSMSMDKNPCWNLLMEYICQRGKTKSSHKEQLLQIASMQEDVEMFLFLHGMSDVYQNSNVDEIPSPDEVNSRWGYWLCKLDMVLKYGNKETSRENCKNNV